MRESRVRVRERERGEGESMVEDHSPPRDAETDDFTNGYTTISTALLFCFTARKSEK